MPQQQQNPLNILRPLLAGFVLVILFQMWNPFPDKSILDMDYYDLIKQASVGNIKEINIQENGYINGSFNDKLQGKTEFKSRIHPSLINELANKLENSSKPARIRFPETVSYFGAIYGLLPLILMIMMGISFYVFFTRMGGGSGPGSFLTSKAKLFRKESNKTTFKDVAGIDEATEELQEVIEFLKNPEKFSKLGGKIPRGILLIGPPGSGKTLLARATAGEANVPFFSIGGSEFVELFVGVGAGRVRNLFEQGNKNAPCIIFIDELDAIGKKRGIAVMGGHTEQEQTLDQILIEMDGFTQNSGVIVIAATNRPDILDSALLRPGRFDRQVTVSLPDMKGRLAILEVHARKYKLSDPKYLETIAKGTVGFSGADLANLLNEAALFASRYDKESIDREHLEKAKDKVMMGSERKSLVLSDSEKILTAYHETGHTLVAMKMPGSDPIHKVTIIPRGMSMGSTWQLPSEDKHGYSKSYLMTRLAILMAGRAAEEFKFGPEEITTGAAKDFEQATQIAQRMICEWGMSQLGPMQFGAFDGKYFSEEFGEIDHTYSQDTAIKIDKEKSRIITSSYNKAIQILKDHNLQFEKLAKELLEKETLSSEQIQELLA